MFCPSPFDQFPEDSLHYESGDLKTTFFFFTLYVHEIANRTEIEFYYLRIFNIKLGQEAL